MENPIREKPFFKAITEGRAFMDKDGDCGIQGPYFVEIWIATEYQITMAQDAYDDKRQHGRRSYVTNSKKVPQLCIRSLHLMK